MPSKADIAEQKQEAADIKAEHKAELAEAKATKTANDKKDAAIADVQADIALLNETIANLQSASSAITAEDRATLAASLDALTVLTTVPADAQVAPASVESPVKGDTPTRDMQGAPKPAQA